MSRGAYGDAAPRNAWESMQDRDARLEQLYSYDKGSDSDLSTLAHVSNRQEWLAGEYMRWFQVNKYPGERYWDAIERWEQVRFGNPLHPAAHGILAFAIRKLANPKSVERKKAKPIEGLKRPKGLTQEQRRERMLDAMSDLADRKAMPTGQAPKKQEPEPADEPDWETVEEVS